MTEEEREAHELLHRFQTVIEEAQDAAQSGKPSARLAKERAILRNALRARLLRAVPGEEAGEEALILEIARRRYEQTRCSGMLACSACPAWDDLSDADRSAWANDWLAPHIRDAVASLRAPSSSEPVSAPSEDAPWSDEVTRAHSHLLDLVLSHRYSGHTLQTAIRNLISASRASPSGRLSPDALASIRTAISLAKNEVGGSYEGAALRDIARCCDYLDQALLTIDRFTTGESKHGE